MIRLGGSSLQTPSLGVGTWAWGERKFWGYEQGYGPSDVVDAFAASLEAGLTFFDTAEVYGHGESEKILGFLARKSGAPLFLATKFALLEGRRGAASIPRALDGSLKRLRAESVDLYQIHWCDVAMASIESLMDAMADAHDAGKIKAIGVSNFSASEMRAAHAALSRRGKSLASNQVHYSLLHRAPEVDGVASACRELGVTLIAYSPLEQGILCGTYDSATRPSGPRRNLPTFSEENLTQAALLIALLREIGEGLGEKPPEQVALRWLMQKPGVLPIAGAKTGEQARRNAGALTLSLDDEAMKALDQASKAWLSATVS